MASYQTGQGNVNPPATRGALVPHFTQIPDVILDRWMAELSGAEFKIVMYVARRTYGFRRETDEISIRQMATGIVRANGERLDSGTGIGESSVPRSVAALVEKGILNATKHTDSRGGSLPSTYSLNLDCVFGDTGMGGGDAANVAELPPPLSQNETPPVSQNRRRVLSKSETPLSQNETPPVSQNETHNIQQFNKQLDRQKDKQHTEVAKASPLASPAVVSSSNDEAVLSLVSLGIPDSDARSIIAEVGVDVALAQARWWPERKAARTAKDAGAVFRTACRGNWAAPRVLSTPVQRRRAVPLVRPLIETALAPVATDPVWNDALERLAAVVNVPTMKTHLRHFVPVSLGASEWVLAAPSAMSRNVVESRYRAQIEAVAQAITGKATAVQFTTGGGTAHVG